MTNKLIPADPNRCQVEKITRHGPFRMGGPIRTVERCNQKPAVIACEVTPGADGQRGEMSICAACLGIAYAERSLPEGVIFSAVP